MENSSKKHLYEIVESVFIGLFTFGVLILLFKIKRFAPFGNNSLACTDANYQYLDFFSYLKDVFSGTNEIDYSFSIGIGQTGIAVFSYYLASPFHLLLLLFDKENMNSFFDIAVALKLSTAAITMSVFLRKRFEEKIHSIFLLLLSMSYALMQYSIAQASNIMWLDGVYMLPLILLGVWYLVRERKTVLLSLSVAVAIYFNWYSAGINCLFTAVWFLFEVLVENIAQKKTWKQNRRLILLYLWSMILGVLLSMSLFWPTILALRGGKGTFDWWIIFRSIIRGNPLSVVWNYSLGAVSSSREVSLYCGSFVLLGCFGIFGLRSIEKEKKWLCGLLLGVSVSIFYLQPLFAVFSLLKSADSYWYRYSYVSIFVLIFLAGLFFSDWANDGCRVKTVRISIEYAVILCVLNFVMKARDAQLILYSSLFAIGIGLLIELCKKTSGGTNLLVKILIVGTVTIELTVNAALLMDQYKITDVDSYKTYVTENEHLVTYITDQDSTSYRVSNTLTRNTVGQNITAIYNEAMHYNYWGIPSYTSAPDNLQMALLERLGYRMEATWITVSNTSILPSDSLLGVKYILSPYEIKGYEKMDGISGAGKNIYMNPYALPMAFLYEKSNGDGKTQYANTFEYVNGLYSRLVGHPVNIYSPAKVEKIYHDNTSVEYVIENVEEHQSLYGNLPWNWPMNGTISINEDTFQGYAQWLSPSVFYIPVINGTAHLTFMADDITGIKDEQFYLLNLDEMEKVSHQIQENKVEDVEFENGFIRCSVLNEMENGMLYLSVPYNKGWVITNNGKVVEPYLFAGDLISIPMQEGKNEVILHYHVPGMQTGRMLSLLGVIFLMITQIWRKKYDKG